MPFVLGPALDDYQPELIGPGSCLKDDGSTVQDFLLAPKDQGMLLVFCRDPLEPSRPDRTFVAEVAAVERLSLPIVLIDHDALVRDDDPARAVRRVPEQPNPVLACYRGWMITPPQYRVLYEALSARNIRLVNDPEQYRHGHHLPENFEAIRDFTPRSVWVNDDLGIDRIMEALAAFGDGPVIVKDFVKSRKHEWAEACFIPSASDRDVVRRIVGRFLELQGDDLNEGLVFREYVEFNPIGVHPRSGMPLTEEFRSFWLDGRLVFQSPYWSNGEYGVSEPPWDRFAGVAASVRSRFFTMDLARQRGGDWMIVEIGDGQVSGLPRELDSDGFFQALAEHCPEEDGPN